MDYFFWDEIFGGRPGLADALFDEPADDEEAGPASEFYSVIIACVEPFQRPPSSRGK